MSCKSHHRGTKIVSEEKKKGLLLLTRMSWTQLDEDLPAPRVTVDGPLSTPYLVDSREENLCNWMDSGFYLSASKDLQEKRDNGADLSSPSGMVQMTVQNYMRSLHRFSEMPIFSRWNSGSSSHSLPNAPKSVTEWLDYWDKDPVEILLDLGFGRDEPDICTKIPSRFISSPSMAKGINIRVFIEAQRQRMDIENPNLCGRFRQLQVLDHVANAFSSLLNDVNALQQKSEEGNQEKNTGNLPREKPVLTQAKRRRLGQLLRKVSRQTTMHGPPAYRNTGAFKNKDEPSAGTEADLHIPARTGLPDNALISLKEVPVPNEEEEAMTVSWPLQSRARKTWLLPQLPIKQPHLPSASEMLPKDWPRKDLSLRLTHRLKRVSGLSWKPSDSFEMEEIQSFEDESSWGNPLESTSDAMVTRTNSSQSDSSGFLEDPLDPLPRQGLSLPGNLRLGCNPHDCQAFLRHRKDSPLTSWDLQPDAEGPVANTATADGRVGVFLPSLSREHTFQGEEVFYSINEEEDLYETLSGRSESAEMDEKEMHRRGGQMEKGGSCGQGCFQCCHIDNRHRVDISSPEGNCLSACSEMHSTVRLSEGQNFEDRQGCEEPGTEEGNHNDVCKEGILEGIAMCADGKLETLKASEKLDSPIPITDITSDCQDVDLDGALRHSAIARASKMEHNSLVAQREINVIPRSAFQDSSLSPYCFTKGEVSSLDLSPTGTELEEDGCFPSFELNLNPLKSVTVQMPSRLMSNMQSIPSVEMTAKGPSLDFSSKVSQCSKDESLITLEQDISKWEEKQTREACIQTDRSQRKKERVPPFHCLPSFHGRGHLVKSASLDTGLFGKYRSYCHEPFNAWCVQCRGHCCSLNTRHCCLMWPLPFAPSCKCSMEFCSAHTSTELQLLKTLKLLQDTAMRNISSCTVHEMEVMKNSCQKFRERLDEIELHLIEQEALFSSQMSDEGREERRQLQDLRRAVRREVTELEGQLQERARQVREGILMQLDQLLGEQSRLCSELGISDWREGSEASDRHLPPDATTAAGCSKAIQRRPPSRSATVPSSPSLLRQPELQASALPPVKTSSASDPKELHTSKKEVKGASQPKIDFKAFLQNLKRTFRNSFSNDAAEGRD
ncbi:protein ITPRID1 [Varanus komodoensis]|uniref:protein ITPRID1 n=1 Tax=Varanus komodoensis TaxID=61221 RepID=UPI001CF78C92|nr:protein ITPRID1 [Varanus komodoensis]